MQEVPMQSESKKTPSAGAMFFRAFTLIATAAARVGKLRRNQILIPLLKWAAPQIRLNNLTVAFLFVLLLVVFVVRSHQIEYVLDPISVPNQYSDEGFSATLMTQRVAARLDSIRNFAATAQNLGEAVSLYEQNSALCGMNFGLLHFLEISVRNCMRDRLSAHFGAAHWFRVAPLPGLTRCGR